MQRRMKMWTNAIVVIAFLLSAEKGLYAGTAWTQWRGPNRDGMIATSVPSVWPNELIKKWELPIGSGHSSPVVWNDRVFVFSREGEEEVVRAIDIPTGKVLWRSAYPAPYEVYPGAAGHGSGPRSTPVLSQNQLFTLGVSGILSAFDAESGKMQWQKKFENQFAEAAPPFGTSMSPMIIGDLLIVHVGGHKGGALLALNQSTGEEKWRLAGEGPSYSSPILFQIQGVQQVVLQAHRKAMGVDLVTGKLLWSIPFVTPCDQNIVTPLQANDLLIFSSLETGTFAVRVEKKNNLWNTEKVWENRDISMYMSSPVYMDGKIIGMSHRKKGQFFALDAKSGITFWTSSGKMAENASLIGAKDSVLILKDDGELQILSMRAIDFSVIKTYTVSNSPTWAHPIPIDSGILIRNERSLILWNYHG